MHEQFINISMDAHLQETSPRAPIPAKLKSLVSLKGISLPTLRRASREKVDTLLQSEKLKIQQKLKGNYYLHDISYLKKETSPQKPPQEQHFPRYLHTDIEEICTSLYNSHEPNLNLFKSRPSPRPKSPPMTFIDKILTPRSKPIADPLTKIQISAPSGRQEAINLKSWLDLMEQKYQPMFAELMSSKGSFDRNKLLSAWKAIYITAMKEIERQTAVNCTERGKLLERVVAGYEQIYELGHTKASIDLHSLQEEHLKEISECRMIAAKQMAFLQARLEFLEKEREEARKVTEVYKKKTQEMEKAMEDIKKAEKSNIRPGVKVNTVMYVPVQQEEVYMEIDEKTQEVHISERLTEDINRKLKKLQEVKNKTRGAKEELKDVEMEISDKQCTLSTVTFEIEMRQNLVKPIARYTPRVNIATNKEKKPLQVPAKSKNEQETANGCEFFAIIRHKSKERLMQKVRVSQDHIFQSISVIYNRAIIQIDASSEVLDFQSLVYRQFVKSEIRHKSEKILKIFIGGCLKFSDFTRVSVFLRLLGLGELINKGNFCTRTFQLYLSLFFYMHNSQLGIVLHQEHISAIQYHPFSRALSCIKDLKSLFTDNLRNNLEAYLGSIVISDPKQINPQGIIELEAFLEKFLELHEDLLRGISQNCKKLFEAVSENSYIPTEAFRLVINTVSPASLAQFGFNNSKDAEALDNMTQISASDAIEICNKFYALSLDDVNTFLGKLADVSDSFAIEMITTQYPSPIPPLYSSMLSMIGNLHAKSGLIWWKLFNE